MKTETSLAIAYSYNLLSFAFQHKELAKKTRAVYLYGSAVRGELTSKSDIDIFFDCEEQNSTMVQKLSNSGILRFEQSLDYEKWRLSRFLHPFSIHAGDLTSWELKASIASEGLLLYGKKPFIEKGERKTLFLIKHPKEKNKYIKLQRLLYGRTDSHSTDKGIVRKLGGESLTTNSFLIPKEEHSQIKDLLVREHADFSMKELILFE